MLRKITTSALFLLIFAVFKGTVPAAAITVFGPHVFERQTGKPVFETADFTNPAAGSDFVIKIVNGDSRGKRRVSAATVTLDGNAVCGPSDLNQQVAELERTVALGRTATLAVITEGAPGGFITVTITGASSQPSVTLNASSPAITAGESALLTWNAINAASCAITPEIGRVALNGSLTVTPLATTTYTITATGPSGTATASATVQVTQPAPTVSLSATPDAISAGQSSVLTWTSSHAVAASIEPGIGDTEPDGSVTVFPSQTTEYTVTVTGPGGTASAAVTVNMISPINIDITTPEEGTSVYKPFVTIIGAVAHNTGSDTGVLVRGIPIIRYGDQFAANHVPLESGVNRIKVMTGDLLGNPLNLSLTLNCVASERYIRLSGDNTSGVAPFKTDLEIIAPFTPSATDLNYEGPGIATLMQKSGGGYEVAISSGGLYLFTAHASDDNGVGYSDTLAIAVYEPSELNVLLQKRWNGMKAALEDGDIRTALLFFLPPSQAKYEKIFTAIGPGLPAFAAAMETIEPVYTDEFVAKYRLRKDKVINGETHRITYYVYFAKAIDGLWYIDSF